MDKIERQLRTLLERADWQSKQLLKRLLQLEAKLHHYQQVETKLADVERNLHSLIDNRDRRVDSGSNEEKQ